MSNVTGGHKVGGFHQVAELALKQVEVSAGDLAWVSTDATHGFVNEGDEPAIWLEAQSPVPPDSDAFFFPDDWRALPR